LQEKSYFYKKCKINQVYINECSNEEVSMRQAGLECSKKGIDNNRIIASEQLGESQAQGNENNSIYNRLTKKLIEFPYFLEPATDNYRIYHTEDCKKKSSTTVKYYKIAGYQIVKIGPSAEDKIKQKEIEKEIEVLENERNVLLKNKKQLRQLYTFGGGGPEYVTLDDKQKQIEQLIEIDSKISEVHGKIEKVHLRKLFNEHEKTSRNKVIYYAYKYEKKCPQYDDFTVLEVGQLYKLKNNEGRNTSFGLVSKVEIKIVPSAVGIGKMMEEDSAKRDMKNE